MNNNTWEMFRENAMETASLQDDPIEYLKKFNDLDVEIEDSLPDMITEIWYRDEYAMYKYLEKNNPERLDRGDRNDG